MTTISVPINLPNVKIININTLNNNDIIIRVESIEIGTHCKHCGRYITKIHSLNKTILLSHFPAFGTPTSIEYQPLIFQCRDCESYPTTTQKPSWYQSAGHCTQGYAHFILNLLVNSTVKDVAHQENITYKRIISIIKRYVPDSVDWSKIENINYLGIDEIALKKGHKEFVVIISTKIEGKARILGVLKNRKNKDCKRFFIEHSQSLSENCKACML